MPKLKEVESIQQVSQKFDVFGLKCNLLAKVGRPSKHRRRFASSSFRRIDDLCNVTNIEEGDKNGPSVTIVISNQEIFIPLAGVIDLEAEKVRLDKELQTSDKDISFLEKRLAKPKYVERAPALSCTRVP